MTAFSLLIAAVVLLYLALKPGRYTYDEQIGGASIRFAADRAWVQASDECYTVSWSVEGIRAVYLNDQGVVGSGSIETCDPFGSNNRLRVVLLDNSEKPYTLELREYPLTNTQSLALIGIAGLCVIGAGATIGRPPHLRASRLTRFVPVMSTSLALRALCIGILLLGLFWRIDQYVFNRPLWGDEAVLSLNIINRSYADLLKPLAENQAAPFGYLLVERLAVNVFGDGEFALRLLSVLASCAALVALYPVARRVLDARAVPIALLLLATSGKQIYYASEIKPYSLDVLFGLLICLLYFQIESRKPTLGNVILWSALGAMALWFSYPALFILIAVGLIVLIEVLRGSREHARRLLIMLGVWGMSFVLNYFVALRSVNGNEYLKTFWAEGFAPYQAGDFPGWLVARLSEPFAQSVFSQVTGVGYLQFALTISLLGLSLLYQQRRSHFLLISLPIGLTLLAAVFRIYPFQDRLILFLAPFFIVALSAGIALMLVRLDSVPLIARVAAGALLIVSLLPINSHILSYEPDFRTALERIETEAHTTDTIYLFGGTSATYIYYSELYGLKLAREINANSDHFQAGKYDFAPNERVWLFRRGTSNDPDWQVTQAYFAEHGALEDQYTSEGGSVYLYQMG